MLFKLFVFSIFILSFPACNSSSSDEAGAPEERFVVDINETISDNKTNLMWVDDETGQGCDICRECTFPESAENFCETLNFKNFDDWRAPTTPELSDLMKSIIEEKKTLHYLVFGCQNNVSTTDYVATTYRSNVGDVVSDGTKGGVRCVRDLK